MTKILTKYIKNLASCTVLCGIGLASFSANAVDAKLDGFLTFQAASRQTKGYAKQEPSSTLSNNNKNAAFYSEVGVSANVSETTDGGMTYGAVINIKSTAKSANLSGSYLFVEHNYGRIEAGSEYSASQKMSVSAYNIASGTGDDYLRYALIQEKFSGASNITSYYTNPSDYSLIYLGSYSASEEQGRNISYYTPKFNGFQLGVTYTPDTSNVGDGDIKNTKSTVTTLQADGGVARSYNVGAKNLISAAVTYEHDCCEDSSIKLGAGIESGATRAEKTVANDLPNDKFANFQVYNIGAIYTYGNYSAALSYADAGKSFSIPELTAIYNKKIKNQLYTAGLAYNQGPLGLSFTYLRNDKFNGLLNSYTVASQYKISRGLLAYAEITPYTLKYKGFNGLDLLGIQTPKANQSGIVYLLGTKVFF